MSGSKVPFCSLYYLLGQDYPFVIDSVDQEEVWGLNRTHFRTSQYSVEEALIEGIGYQGGLFVGARHLPSTADWGVFLHDYCVGAAADCGLLSSTAPEKMLPAVRVFPNPIRQGEPLWLEKPEGIAAYHTVELVDAMGRVRIRKAYTPANRPYISTTGLAPGFYVMQFRSKEGHLLQVEKVVIE